MSTETSTESQPQLVPAYGSSSDNNSTADSFRPVTYKDLVRNPDLFWDLLRDFLGHTDKIKIPIVGGNSLDLHQLFIEVTSRGGIEQVIKDRKCKAVIRSLNFTKSMTNAAYVLKKYYLKMLFAFEHVYFFQEPMSLFSLREEAMKRLVNKTPNHDNGTHELQAGCLVNGVINGKFDDGYFVTMKVGSQELKGVLFRIHEASPETQRVKKKTKASSQMDSYRPKAHRSGYNFFVSDQSQRLQLEHGGKERYPIKEIGNLWSNLSESDRKVYQDKGFEDVERYRTEMSEYNAFIDSCAVETDDAETDDGAENDG